MCYGMNCPNEDSHGECRYNGNVRACPINESFDEWDDNDSWYDDPDEERDRLYFREEKRHDA